MAKDKPAFQLYNDQIHLFNDLTDEEAGKLIKIIFSYVNDENPEITDRIMRLVFEPIKRQLKRDLVKYEKKREKNVHNANMRWHPTASDRIPNDATASDPMRTDANDAVTVTDKVTVTDTVTVKRERRAFAPPSRDEVIDFMSERIGEFYAMGEAEKFLNYYSSNGWKVGKNKMKNWPGAAAGWISRMENFKNDQNGKQLGTSGGQNAAGRKFVDSEV